MVSAKTPSTSKAIEDGLIINITFSRKGAKLAKKKCNRSRNVEIGNWKFGLHAFVLFFPISILISPQFLISIFKFQAVNGYNKT